VVDEIQFKIVWSTPSGFSLNTPMRLNMKDTLPAVEIAAVLVEDTAHARRSSIEVVGGRLDDDGYAVRL
jgi:hypothetical protein